MAFELSYLSICYFCLKLKFCRCCQNVTALRTMLHVGYTLAKDLHRIHRALFLFRHQLHSLMGHEREAGQYHSLYCLPNRCEKLPKDQRIWRWEGVFKSTCMYIFSYYLRVKLSPCFRRESVFKESLLVTRLVFLLLVLPGLAGRQNPGDTGDSDGSP